MNWGKIQRTPSTSASMVSVSTAAISRSPACCTLTASLRPSLSRATCTCAHAPYHASTSASVPGCLCLALRQHASCGMDQASRQLRGRMIAVNCRGVVDECCGARRCGLCGVPWRMPHAAVPSVSTPSGVLSAAAGSCCCRTTHPPPSARLTCASDALAIGVSSIDAYMSSGYTPKSSLKMLRTWAPPSRSPSNGVSPPQAPRRDMHACHSRSAGRQRRTSLQGLTGHLSSKFSRITVTYSEGSRWSCGQRSHLSRSAARWPPRAGATRD